MLGSFRSSSPLWVINGSRRAFELGPVIPQQRTCGASGGMSEKCQYGSRNSYSVYPRKTCNTGSQAQQIGEPAPGQMNWSKERGQDKAKPDTSEIMAPIAHNLTEAEVKAVAAYLSYLQ